MPDRRAAPRKPPRSAAVATKPLAIVVKAKKGRKLAPELEPDAAADGSPRQSRGGADGGAQRA